MLFEALFSGWLFIRRNPTATHNVIFSLYQFIRRAGRFDKCPTYNERKAIGQFILSNLGGLLISIENAMADAEALRNERISILSKPFDAEELRKSNRKKWRVLQLDRPLDSPDQRFRGGSGPAKRAAMRFPIPLRQGGMRPRKENEKT